MNRKISYFLLFLILALGMFLRIKNISTNPPELFSDEIVPVVSTQSILKTGLDINGKLLPYFYNRLQLYPPMYGYLTVPSIYLFGLNIFAIRLPAVIAGVLTILILFLVTRELFGNIKVALLAAFFLSIIPWTTYFSRVAWPQSLFLLFILIPIYFFLKYIRKKSLVYLYLSIGFFALSFYSYYSSEFLSPMFLAVLTFLYRKHIKADFKHYIFAIIIAFILLLPFFYTLIKEPVLMNARTERISTFAKGINKDTVSIFINNYFSHLTLDFLFLKGDPNLRQGTGRNGVLYFSMLPFLILGFYSSLKKFRKPAYMLLIVWMLIFPLGGSLTNDGVPHATRTLIGAPLFSILTAIGLNFVIEFTKKIKRKLTRVLILASVPTLVLIAIFIEVSGFYKTYFFEYPIYSSSWWEYGESQIFSYVKNFGGSYKQICMENLNYWNEETLTKYYLPNSNLKIIAGIDSKLCIEKSTLEVIYPGEAAPKGATIVKEIPDLLGHPYWLIYSR